MGSKTGFEQLLGDKKESLSDRAKRKKGEGVREGLEIPTCSPSLEPEYLTPATILRTRVCLVQFRLLSG